MSLQNNGSHLSKYIIFKFIQIQKIFPSSAMQFYALFCVVRKLLSPLTGRTEEHLEYVKIKCQLDATEVFIAYLIACSTCFGASLCPSSGAQEYYTVVAACGILCCGFFKYLVWCGAEGYASGLQDAGKPAYCKPDA